MDEYYEALQNLPDRLQLELRTLPESRARLVQEIRIRVYAPVTFVMSGESVPAARYCSSLQKTTPRPEDMQELLFCLCGGSVHSFSDELGRGYLTLPGGHRAGIGGRYCTAADGTFTLQELESVNLRVARFSVCTLPQSLAALLQTHFGGIVISGEPGSGKTTILRSMIPYLAKLGRQTAVIDERCEILPQLRQSGGFGCDRIAGLRKAAAVEMALRALGPQVILLDEVGNLAEAQALEQGFFSGVDCIVTLHAGSLEEMQHKPQYRYMASRGMLHYACQLNGRSNPGTIREETFDCGFCDLQAVPVCCGAAGEPDSAYHCASGSADAH